MGVDATLAADTLTSVVTDLSRNDVPVDDIRDEHWESLFTILESGELTREAIPEVLEAVARSPDRSVEAVIDEEGLTSADEEIVREAVQGVVQQRREQIEDEGMEAFSGLMGECMSELRGKAEGELVSSVLREEMNRIIS
jgi:glutamyl-tRNA(Gln) amidotransferase subunit E